jgi:hypothetical protein
VLQWLLKGLRAITSGLRSGGGLVMKGLNLLRTILTAGLSAARRLGGLLKKVFAKLGELVDQIVNWFRRAFGRVAGRFKKGGRKDNRRGRDWRLFKASVRSILAANGRRGIALLRLQEQMMRLQNRHRRAVASVSVRPKRGTGYLDVRARRRGSLLGFRGKVLMDAPTRWHLGGLAIQKRLKLLKRLRVLLMITVKASMRSVQRKFGYQSLEVHFESEASEFVVKGEMNPAGVQGRLRAPRPARNDLHLEGDRSARVDPLVRTSRYAKPIAWPSDTAGVRRIRLASTIIQSLYVRGHLVSGKLGGSGAPGNLTPITRSANAEMESVMESRVKALLRKSKDKRSVFSYAVRGVGEADGPIHHRATRPTKGAARVWQLVPDERKLARTISMVLKRKRYNHDSGHWVNDRVVDSRRVHSVPPFPVGWREPKPSQLKAGDKVSSA